MAAPLEGLGSVSPQAAEAAATSRLIHETLDQTPEGATTALREALETDGAAGFWRTWIEINQITPKELFWAVDVAKSHLQIGQLEEALANLELGFERRRPNMVYLGVDPIWDPLRSDPRFQDLLVRMKLPQAPEPESLTASREIGTTSSRTGFHSWHGSEP